MGNASSFISGNRVHVQADRPFCEAQKIIKNLSRLNARRSPTRELLCGDRAARIADSPGDQVNGVVAINVVKPFQATGLVLKVRSARCSVCTEEGAAALR